MRIFPLVVPTLLGFTASAFAGVTVASPATNTSVTTPTTFVAHATTSTCWAGVAAMGIYVDDQLEYVVNGTSMNTSLRMPLGQHYVVVQDWDYCGGAAKQALNLNVIQPTVSFGSVTVKSPTPGQTVTSPFTLSATDSVCEGQPVDSMAYSLDNSSTLLALVNGSSLSTQVSTSAGTHALHVKSWGPNYAACDTDLTVNVVTATSAASSATSVIPSSAMVVRNIQTFLDWQDWFDTGTIVGSDTTASGNYASLVSSPSLSGSARRFVSTFVNNGGILYYNNVTGNNPDTTSQNWFVDEWVYVTAPSTDLANVEIDMNQVDPSGNTIIMGFQCDGWNGVWDYTWTDTGTHWTQSKQPCNPRNWTTNAWHHVQIYFSHDNQDNVTYHTVWFDGQQQDINATVYSALPLGWANSNIMNFQIDGMGQSGSITTYLDNVTVYHW